MLTKEKPARVIGDKAYDSGPLDAELDTHGIEMIAPNRSICGYNKKRTAIIILLSQRKE
jgi:hypothetical protein